MLVSSWGISVLSSLFTILQMSRLSLSLHLDAPNRF